MSQRGQPTTLQERYAIMDRAAAGQSDPQIAAALGRPVSTIRKWRRIAQRQGHARLISPMGRPATGPLSSFPADLQATIRQLRTQHPGWGPDTLLAELRRDPRWADQRLPSAARLSAFLKHSGLSRPYQKQRPLPQPLTPPPQQPHDAWQLDAQGATPVAGVGTVSIINIVDEVSHLKVERCPVPDTTQPATADYQLALRRAFTTHGLPQASSLDHGSTFYDNTTASPFPPLLHLWLIALGILVCFTRKRCPTDHALIERTHQTITG